MVKRQKGFGADQEADNILDRLPRNSLTAPNAWVHIDAAGRLMITIVEGGLLILNERDLAYLHGDELS